MPNDVFRAIDAVLVLGALQNVPHEDARRVYGVGRNLPGLDQVLHLGDRALGRRGHHGIEVARGLPVDEVAEPIATVRAHEREVGFERHLQHVGPAVDDARLLALGDDRVAAGLREEAADAGAAGADALGKRALRDQFDVQFPREKLALELAVLAHVARDHLANLVSLEQRAQAEVVDAGVVADDGEVARAAAAESEQKVFRVAADAESPAHDRRAVEDSRDRLIGGVEHLVHDAIMDPDRVRRPFSS